LPGPNKIRRREKRKNQTAASGKNENCIPYKRPYATFTLEKNYSLDIGFLWSIFNE
jgi:hypothetical protein